MGFEEYNLIKTTMLEVAEKNNSIEAIKSDIDGIESRKEKINGKIAKLRKDIEEMNSQFDWFDSETVEKYESELKSYEKDLAEYTAKEDKALRSSGIIFIIGAIVSFGLISVEHDAGVFACGFSMIVFLFGAAGFDEEKEKSINDKIRSKQYWLEEFFKLPQEIEKLEKSISKENEEIKESDTEIEDLEKDIEKINSEISDMMDSIKHLIPYADKI